MLHLLFDLIGSVLVDGLFHGIAGSTARRGDDGRTGFSPVMLVLVMALLALIGSLGLLVYLVATAFAW
jgi:hypothetical protein